MTVVVYRDGIMAADSAGWAFDVMVTTGLKKIIRLPDGGLAGFCGRSAAIDRAKEWLLSGSEDRPTPEEKDQLFGIVVRPGGPIQRVDWDFRIYEAEPAEFYVIGSCGEFVIGALAAGVSAPVAVSLAIEFCDGAGGRMCWERLEPSE